MNTRDICSNAQRSIPRDTPLITTWAPDNVYLPGSVIASRFNLAATPWLEEPLLRATDRTTRQVTFMKPVQTGGSVLGEVVMLYWIEFAHGFLQYNWSNNERAMDRWNSRIDGIIHACPPVARRLKDMPRFESKKCEIDFGSVFFRMQGVFVADNLDSDTIPLQINEELHAWEKGHFKKAEGRSTFVWNYKRLNISNAGEVGGELDVVHSSGTRQRWEQLCPGCGHYHAMRTKWEPRRPELGGLRYDGPNGADYRRPDGTYDYNRIRTYARFQMPCGYTVGNDVVERRQLSSNSRYSEPTNDGAELSNRSYTYEAVSIDRIDWVQLIKEKHEAIAAFRNGDPKPWVNYRQQRECIPSSLDDAPLSGGTITIQTKVRKSREGIPLKQGDPHQGEKTRFFSFDRQQGNLSRNEFAHWWGVIRDAALKIVEEKDENGQLIKVRKLWSRLVWEGKCETDEQAIGILDEHECRRWCGTADSGDDTMHVYQFCMRYGINAIKGGAHAFYIHANGARRIYSPERPLHPMAHAAPMFPYLSQEPPTPDPREPLFWLYSKMGIRERLHWLRQSPLYETPVDVSEEYQSHMESEQRQERRNVRTGEPIVEWIQYKKRNDQFVNECYIAMQMEMAGLVGNVKLPKALEQEQESNNDQE